ncbi:MAG: hypothetical protein ACXWWE_08985, partial [Nitrospira sp.]
MSYCYIGWFRAGWLFAIIGGACFLSGVNVADGSVSDSVEKVSVAMQGPELPEAFGEPASESR